MNITKNKNKTPKMEYKINYKQLINVFKNNYFEITNGIYCCNDPMMNYDNMYKIECTHEICNMNNRSNQSMKENDIVVICDNINISDKPNALHVQPELFIYHNVNPIHVNSAIKSQKNNTSSNNIYENSY